MRLISICPSNTELAYYLGLEDQLIGVDDYSDWPDSVDKLPRLGPDLSINMDKVEELQPDLVLASLSVPGMEKNIAELEKRKIPHIVLNPNSLTEIGENILELGKLTNKVDVAKEVHSHYHEIIKTYQTISEQIEDEDRQKLYWEWWPKPIFTPGGSNWLTEISGLAGGSNVFADQTDPSIQTDWEEVKQREPDHICMVWVGVKTEKMKPKAIIARPGSSNIKAIQNDNIHVLEEKLFCRPSPRLLQGLSKLASILHPNIFPPYENKDPLQQKLLT